MWDIIKHVNMYAVVLQKERKGTEETNEICPQPEEKKIINLQIQEIL